MGGYMRLFLISLYFLLFSSMAVADYSLLNPLFLATVAGDIEKVRSYVESSPPPPRWG